MERDLAAVTEDLARLVRRLATAGDLSVTAAAVLAHLGRVGPQRLTELARCEAVSQPGMTQLVTRLEREGLVRRAAHGDDRRVVLVEATETGLALIERRRAERAQALGALVHHLPAADRSAIEAALPALARLAASAGVDHG